MWLRFSKDFDFSPAARNGHVTIAYKAGAVENVTRECADQALAAGVAEEPEAEKASEPVDGEAAERG